MLGFKDSGEYNNAVSLIIPYCSLSTLTNFVLYSEDAITYECHIDDTMIEVTVIAEDDFFAKCSFEHLLNANGMSFFMIRFYKTIGYADNQQIIQEVTWVLDNDEIQLN